MATTFTSSSIPSSDGGGRKMYVYCTQTKGSSSENYSTINWTLYSTGGSTYYTVGPTTLTLDGTQRYYKARVGWTSYAFPAKDGSTSGSFTKSHNNDGSVGSVHVQLSTAIYESTLRYVDEWWNMDSIARYFSSTPSLSLASRTETSLTFNWSTSETCDYVWVYRNGAYYTEFGANAKSGSFSVSGSANTSYNVSITCRRKDSQLTTGSGTSTNSTYAYPHMTSTPDFTIGNTHTMKVYNPLGRKLNVWIVDKNNHSRQAGGDTIYGDTISGYTGSGFQDFLYQTIPNSTSGQYQVRLKCEPLGRDEIAWGGTFYTRGSETPTFSNSQVSTFDASTTVTNVTKQTGAGGWLVQGLSQLKVNIDSAATPNKFAASISKYEVTFNGVTKTINSTGNVGTWNVYNNSGTAKVSIKAIDSRGLATTVEKSVEFKPYSPPSLLAFSGVRTGNLQGNTTSVALSGRYQFATVADTNKATVSWGGSAGEWRQDGSVQVTNSNSAYEPVATDVPNTTTVSFSMKIKDSFGNEDEKNVFLPKGFVTPIMFVDSEQVGVGVNCYPTGPGIYSDGTLLDPTQNLWRFGEQMHLDEEFKEGLNGLSVYNNNSTGAVTISHVDLSSSDVTIPNSTKKAMKVVTNGSAKPAAGGFYFGDTGFANAIMTYILVAKIPVGYKIRDAANAHGDGGHSRWLTSQLGTGKWETYICQWKYGSTGSMSNVGFFYLQVLDSASQSEANPNGLTNQHVEWYVAQATGFINNRQVLSEVYPTGAIYMSTSSTSPAQLFGGSWERIQGRFLWATGSTPTQTGGSQTSSISIDHTHWMYHRHWAWHAHGQDSHYHGVYGSLYAFMQHNSGNFWFHERDVEAWWDTGRASASGASSSTANSQAIRCGGSTEWAGDGGIHNNLEWTGWSGEWTGGMSANTNPSFSIMPPYYEVYVWRRTG